MAGRGSTDAVDGARPGGNPIGEPLVGDILRAELELVCSGR